MYELFMMQSLEEQFPHKEDYQVANYYDFKFSGSGDPHIQVIVPTEHPHCDTIAMDPMAARVNITRKFSVCMCACVMYRMRGRNGSLIIIIINHICYTLIFAHTVLNHIM